jgi:hypothetical protein
MRAYLSPEEVAAELGVNARYCHRAICDRLDGAMSSIASGQKDE